MKNLVLITWMMAFGLTLLGADTKTYREDGSLKMETIYKDNNRTRIEKVYHKNGNLLLIQTFKNDKMCDTEKWYFEDGKLWMETEYKDSQQNGFDKKYSKEGFLLQESFYKEGKKVGITKIYDKKGLDSCAMCKYVLKDFINRDKYKKFCFPCIESKKDQKIHDIIYSGILIKEKKFKEGIEFLTKLLATKYKDDTTFTNDLAYLFNKIGEYDKAYKLRKTLLYRDVYLFENTNYVDYLELELILNKQPDKKAQDYYGQKFKKEKETTVAQKLTFEMLDNLLRIQNKQEAFYEIEKVEMSVKNQYENHVPSNLTHLKKWIETKPKGMQLKLEAVLAHYEDLMRKQNEK